MTGKQATAVAEVINMLGHNVAATPKKHELYKYAVGVYDLDANDNEETTIATVADARLYLEKML